MASVIFASYRHKFGLSYCPLGVRPRTKGQGGIGPVQEGGSQKKLENHWPTPTLPPCNLLGICCAPPQQEAPPFATQTWLGAGRRRPVCHIYLHQGQLKRARTMIARRGMRRKMYRGRIHRNLTIQNRVRQNAPIRTDHISHGHIDSSVTMS